MSLVTVQLGQCGNQIGGQLFDTISRDLNAPSSSQCLPRKDNQAYCQSSQERFFHVPPDGTPEARAVMVDMEPKVIAQTVAAARASGTWAYPRKRQFAAKRGSGNNWAHGFCVHGPRVREEVMEMVRKEVERCDRHAGFQTILSLAGGTGSGVGTFVNQCLRDDYPHSFILNHVVWPYQMGEVIVQNYNAVLTLSHLYQSSDALLVMENDHVQKICSQLLGISKVSFQDLNKVIAHNLASTLLPAYDGGKIVRNHLGSMLELLVSHPGYKLLTIRSIPQMSKKALAYSSFMWPGLLKHLRQMLVANAPMEEGIDWNVKTTGGATACFNHSVANLLILRGKDAASADVSAFRDPRLYPSWVLPGSTVNTWTSSRPFNQYEKSAVLVTNSQSLSAPLDRVVGKAWNMFASRAYVHQYLAHGLNEEDFVDSFACLEQVVARYQRIS